MRVLVVDDEPLAQTAFSTLLAKRGEAENCDAAGDAIEALQKLATKSYDVLLLDINMPELTGTELLNQLRERCRQLPSIVFVTAHNERAIAAFERDAADYVLKPFLKGRIEDALGRASRRAEGEGASKFIEDLPQLQGLSRTRHPRIAIKANGRIIFINPDDVLAVEAEGNYVLLQRSSGSYLLRESISSMAEKLKPYGFIRIHRSVLVNAPLVEEVKPYSTGEYGLRVKGGKEYTVTRTYKKNLKSLAEFWLGAGPFLAD
ncbi:MAG: LytR/AlgR family response regulator transcription factor [Candidatus Sulfotelmatobacter sp.]